MSKTTVRLVEFEMSKTSKQEVEETIADLIDEGFSIAAQHNADGWANFTMVRTHFGISQMIQGSGDKAAPKAIH